jgi:23S rRNA (adenine-N6)-dimethyltransferase
VSAGRRTPRDERRRRLGQNFLPHAAAERIVAEAAVRPGELIVDIGAGAGALTLAAARRGARVIAIEVDSIWVRRLRENPMVRANRDRIRVELADVLDYPLPQSPFRVIACLPFGATTAILRRLLDDPRVPLQRADLVVQAEVARKRAVLPPGTLLSTTWIPWWDFRSGRELPGAAFRPKPQVDAAVLIVTRRQPPLLPVPMAPDYARFVRAHWPFGGARW